MFEVTLEKQKIIMFLPFVNLFGLLIWVNNCFFRPHSAKTTFKGGLWAVGHFLPVITLQFVLERFFPELSSIFGYVSMYLAPLAMDLGLIRYQEKYIL